MKFQAMALLAVLEVVETYVVNLFENAYLCAVHVERVKMMPRIFNWNIGSGGLLLSISQLKNIKIKQIKTNNKYVVLGTNI